MFSTISVHENVDALWISAYFRLHSAGCVPCALFAHWHRRAVKCDFLYTADLIEIATAIDLAQETIPSSSKLSDGFARLSAYGLIVEIDGGYALTDDAQKCVGRVSAAYPDISTQISLICRVTPYA